MILIDPNEAWDTKYHKGGTTMVIGFSKPMRLTNATYLYYYQLIRPWLGGKGRITPPPPYERSQNFKTMANIDTKLTVPYSALICHPNKISAKSVEFLFRKCRFSDVVRRFCVKKNSQLSKVSGM